MKEVRSFLIADVIVLLVKVLGGLLVHSYTMLASGVCDVAFIIVTLLTIKVKENSKVKGIFSSFIGFVLILLGIGTIFLSFLTGYHKQSFFILLFILLSLIIRYAVSCFCTNVSYQKKKGLLSLGVIQSNFDFISYGIILGVFILNKLSKWFSICRYADYLGVILISLFVIIKGIKIIVNSIKYLENKEDTLSDEVKEEIIKRDEVKKLEKLDILSFGGIKKANCSLVLKDGINMLDTNTFVVTLQDYLLKFANVVKINLVDGNARKVKPKVRSLKQDARNSRSGNSKTNAKKKNTQKKNKKR